MNIGTMKNLLQNNIWNQSAVKVHVGPPLITLNKNKNDEITTKNLLKLNCAGISRQKLGPL